MPRFDFFNIAFMIVIATMSGAFAVAAQETPEKRYGISTNKFIKYGNEI
jgi:hypothetical protein